ncbi:MULTISPECIES: hypothetical protein [Streptomyces]|uniref:Lipoprotein n=1 Tax=Streptomyces virginiae TaxID=1961 RepID=A0ABQ3NDT7_STRVG|nr:MULTISPECIES: hypothetical protein [Streptomyces]GLV95647.1 hypothetical protein Slala04_71000 [Streptomyces lavendulae subsp. lavendulae]KOU13584.1 hypothetical protein ADK49_25300 [Streptomyces sp. WM6349]KOU83908.1 hypothetical protein ADK94_19900 [Streptomyces sp. XY593]KOV03032.1 hypothetical protein ADK92_08940 [Streptomyces sp. XY533]KOV46247.1 hypothetical protein ADK98_13915 [Streptomyces sp. H036]
MKRTRTAAVALATAAAALAPVLVQQATAAEGTYLQDPAGGEKTMKSMWTKDEMHKVEGQFRFHPGVQYKTVSRPGHAAAPDYERKVGDPETLAWQPSYEFAWSVSDSTVVKKAVTVKEGEHPIVVHAVLRRADRSTVAEVRKELKGKPATGREKVAGGRRIACDTGEYTVEWSVTRSGYGTLTGSLRWDSSCEQYRTAFSQDHGKQR